MFTEYDYEVWLVSFDGLLWRMTEAARGVATAFYAVFDPIVAEMVDRFQRFAEQLDRDILGDAKEA